MVLVYEGYSKMDIHRTKSIQHKIVRIASHKNWMQTTDASLCFRCQFVCIVWFFFNPQSCMVAWCTSTFLGISIDMTKKNCRNIQSRIYSLLSIFIASPVCYDDVDNDDDCLEGWFRNESLIMGIVDLKSNAEWLRIRYLYVVSEFSGANRKKIKTFSFNNS